MAVLHHLGLYLSLFRRTLTIESHSKTSLRDSKCYSVLLRINQIGCLAVGDDDFGIGRLGKFTESLDASKLDDFTDQAFGQDFLRFPGTFRFDFPAFGFLSLPIEHILHLLGFLFGGKLALDGTAEFFRQFDTFYQDPLDDKSRSS